MLSFFSAFALAGSLGLNRDDVADQSRGSQDYAVCKEVALEAVRPVKFVGVRYPDEAIQARVQGSVRMVLSVSVEGRVEGVTRCVGIPLLDASCQRALERWRFPASEESRSVHVACRYLIEDADAGKLVVLPNNELEIHAKVSRPSK